MSNDAATHHESSERNANLDQPAARRGGWAPSLLALVLAVAVAACTNPLDVENPNKLTEEDVSSPTAMSSVTNGAQSAVTRGIQAIGGVYLAASDEITWIGSRDAWQQLDFGNVDDPVNEFSDAAFPYVAEGRYMADRAISQGEGFQSEGTLPDPILLARAYLYGAIMYTTIAEQFDDFVLPDDPQEAVPPVGPGNMNSLFQTAIDYATSGIGIARDEGDTELEARLLSVRARAYHSLGVWNKLNPAGSTPSDPLVASAEARADAQDVLGLVNDNWRYQLTFDNIADIVVGDLSFALQVNERGEIQIGPEYVSIDPDSKTDITGIVLNDPIDDVPDPVIDWKLDEFRDGYGAGEPGQYAPMTVTSAREMHLIVAEDELANSGDTGVFRQHINAVRSLDGLTDYTGQVPAEDILEHERRVNLFLMFRRLTDMYRFGAVDPQWQPQSPAVREPGTMLPITITEIRSNENL